jgi:hypothetical protein
VLVSAPRLDGSPRLSQDSPSTLCWSFARLLKSSIASQIVALNFPPSYGAALKTNKRSPR